MNKIHNVDYPFYTTSQEFWIGAHVAVGGDGEWDWDGHNRPMEGVYENWRAATQGYGCPDEQCTDDHAMYLRPKSAFDWRADVKTAHKAFVCIAKCERGYKWYDGVQKCVRVVGSNDPDNVR